MRPFGTSALAWSVVLWVSSSTGARAQERPSGPPEVAARPAAVAEAGEQSAVELEEVVVTAHRSPTPREETPAAIEIVGERDLAATEGDQLPVVLKKTTSVDVIQYPGALAGLSIRGFRPDLDGITKHQLVLIDGRPAGAANLATILKDDLVRIEVLKGPASALYGGEAMGGVVNVITRQSRGPIEHHLTLGGGSFGMHHESLASGGAALPWLDYDASFGNRSQLDDYRMGNGQIRRRTSYQERHLALRLGSSFGGWRANARGEWYLGRDLGNPGPLYDGDTRQATQDVDRYGGDLSISGPWGPTVVRATLYASREQTDYISHGVGEPAYRAFASGYGWCGVQLQDSWSFSGHELTAGLDYHRVRVETRNWSPTGARLQPYSPDNGRDDLAVFLDGSFRFWEERLILDAGLRVDTFLVSTQPTPYLPDAVAGSSRFSRLSPRAGARVFLTDDRLLQLHATIGTAFVPPAASLLFVHAETDLGEIVLVTQGNPRLGPEWALTWDLGVTVQTDGGLHLDVTWFDTAVHDKIASVQATETVTTYVNADSAVIRGLEVEASWDLGRALHWGREARLFAGGTWLPQARETLTSAGASISRDIYNVSRVKYTVGLAYDDGRLFGRLAARYLGVRQDNDWYTVGFPEIRYGPFVVADLSLGLRFLERHLVTLSVENLLDAFYFEKPEYPLPGRAFRASYSVRL